MIKAIFFSNFQIINNTRQLVVIYGDCMGQGSAIISSFGLQPVVGDQQCHKMANIHAHSFVVST
jgi:hypothetical protein